MDTLEDTIKELFYWQHGYSNSFYNRLIDIFRIADSRNQRRLSQVYPYLPIALNMWENSEDYGEALFKQYGLIK